MALTKEILTLLIPDDENVINYTHRTDNEDVARKIIKTGFKFTESFYKTTDIVINNPVNLNYVSLLRKAYGKYVVVISFAKEVIKHYESILFMKLQSNIVEVQQILTETEPEINEDNEEVYTLTRQFIKGYFNEENENVVYNPDFNPYYESTVFITNIDRIKRTMDS
jgi:predicted metal-binding protein